MAFCEYCGGAVEASMRFCPGCGAPLQGKGAASATKSDYRVILQGLGSCSHSNARNLLEDLLGYSSEEAREILRSLPAEAACCLNEQQARTLAQALTEYGMQVAVCDADDYVELGQKSGETVYSEDGTLRGHAFATLATLGLINRVNRIRRWNRPGLLERLFLAPGHRPPPPPVRHHIHPVYTRPVKIHIPRPPMGMNSGRRGPGGMPGTPGRGPRPSGDFHHFGPGGRGPGRR